MNCFATTIIAGILSFHCTSESTLYTPHSTLYTPQKSVTLLFTGDILLDRGVRPYLENGGIHRIIPDETADFLRSADVVVGNLECPVTTIKAPAFKRFVFRGEPQWLDSLRICGFTHMNIANNHSVDQGRHGLADTWRNIVDAGMCPVGADSTMLAAVQPVLLSAKPRKVWLLATNRLPLENFAYMPDRFSPSQEPMDSLLSRIRQLRSSDSTAIVIVSPHWGVEHTVKPTLRQRLDAHAMIDAGANAVIGHHTHSLQEHETYRGRHIYYSIGNFIFDLQHPINTKAAIVRLHITQDDITVDDVPIRITNCAPELL